MTRQNDNVLGLAPLGPNDEWGFDPTQIALDELANSNADINGINTGVVNQKVMINAHASKARFALSRLMDTDKFSGDAFYELVTSVMAINQEMVGKPGENYTVAFNDRLLKLSSRHIYGILEVTARSIAKEVMQQAKPPAPKSFLERLLGPGS